MTWAPAAACRVERSPGEAVLRCASAVVVEGAEEAVATRLQWRVGFDSVLVSSTTDLVDSIDLRAGSARLIAQVEPPVARSDARSQRRLALLRAQWWHYDGRPETALEMLAELDAAHPESPDVLAFRARIDLERGRTRRAEEVYREALQQAPRRSDLRRAVAELSRQRAPAVEVERSARDVGGVWRENRVAVSGRRDARSHLQASGKFEYVEGSITGVRLRSGEIASPTFQQWLAEGSLERQLVRGTRLRGGLAIGPAGLGSFGGVEFANAAGRTLVSAERNRPFGEFLEGAAQAGSRDRVELTRQQTLGSRGGAWAVAARNRYRLERDALASSYALTLGGVYHIRRRSPSVSVQYGFDMEAGIERQMAESEQGPFAPLNVSSRRVHVGGLNVVQPVGKRIRLDLSGGYAIDQLGGRGTFGQARLWTPTTRRVNGDVWAEYRLHVLTTAQRATRVGARAWVTF
jgi:tetratricopeptide (TPR) repeat protein